MVKILRYLLIFSLLATASSVAFSEDMDISTDDDMKCSAMAAALPETSDDDDFNRTGSVSLNVAKSQLKFDHIVSSWNEFVLVAHKMVENKLNLGTSVVVATQMPFEDRPGTLYNPGCFYNSKVFLSKEFIKFSFDKSYPERSAVAIGLLFHEMGHAFSKNYADRSYADDQIDQKLRSIPKANELFADYFAGYIFYFWHRWVRTNLNSGHPVLGDMIQYISSFDHFNWTFKYFGCYTPSTTHGDYNQRQEAFTAGAVAAESTGKLDLSAVSETDIKNIAILGAATAIRISKKVSVVPNKKSCR